MFNKEKYEKADIKEQVKVFSQTEPGYVFVCSRKRYRKPVYKWNDYYFSIDSNIPQTVEELQTHVLYGDPTKPELEKLLKFLNSKKSGGFNMVETYIGIQLLWEAFHPGNIIE